MELVEADIDDTDSLDSLMKRIKFSAIVHFAASIVVSESVSDPLSYYKNNTIKTTKLIELCFKNKISNFIFSSTAAVYGNPDSSLIPIDEETSLSPINPYGASKFMSERVLRDVGNLGSGFRYVMLRYFNVSGASLDGGLGQRSKNATHLIKVASEVACGKREFMNIFGEDYDTEDGTCVRDYVHIDDLARAHIDSLEYLERGGKSNIFNVGYGKGYSVKQVIDVMKRVSGVDFTVFLSERRDMKSLRELIISLKQ